MANLIPSSLKLTLFSGRAKRNEDRQQKKSGEGSSFSFLAVLARCCNESFIEPSCLATP
jgi:hypothetical protein